MAAPSAPSRKSASDRTDLLVAATAGAIAVGWTLVELVLRLGTVFSNREVPIPVWIEGATAALPLPDGVAEVDLTTGIATVSDMPPFILWVVALAAIVRALAVLAVTGLTLALFANLARGRIFGRPNTLLISGIAAAIVIGWFLTNLFTQMASNSAVNVLTGRAYESAQIPTDWTPALAALGVAVLAVVFRQGERLQRDTEGLV